jgi:hypothetical protein
VNLEFYRGDNFTLTLTFYENGVIKDITGWTVWFTIKQYQDDLDVAAVLQKKVTVHLDPTNGVTAVSVTAAENLFAGRYYYDIQYKTGGGVVQTVLSGEISFIKDITLSTT